MVALDFPQAHKEVEFFAGVVDVFLQFVDSSRSLEELFALAQITALALAQQARRCQFFKLHVAVELDVLAHPLLRWIADTLYHDRFAFNHVQDDEMSRENDNRYVRFWIFDVKGKNFRSLPVLSVHQTLNKTEKRVNVPAACTSWCAQREFPNCSSDRASRPMKGVVPRMPLCSSYAEFTCHTS